MPENKNQILAEKIAKILGSDSSSDGDPDLWKAVESISQRLDALERSLGSEIPRSGSGNSDPVSHPSMHRYTVVDALADQVADRLKNERACSFEPNGKPCDSCLMCSSRGF